MKVTAPVCTVSASLVWCLSILCIKNAEGTNYSISPGNLQGWSYGSSGVGSSAQIDGFYPQDTDGSASSATARVAVFEPYQYAGFGTYWDPIGTANPYSRRTTLSQMSACSYDLLRSMRSTSPSDSNLAPTLMLTLWNDVNSDEIQTNDETAWIIWDARNNAVDVPQEKWVSIDAIGGNWWQISPGVANLHPEYALSLGDWFDPNFKKPEWSTSIDSDTMVSGIWISVGGHNWGPYYTEGAFDNTTIGFGDIVNNYDFATAPERRPGIDMSPLSPALDGLATLTESIESEVIPEPKTLMLLALCLPLMTRRQR